MQLEVRDFTIHAGVFGMDISACVFIQWQFKNNQKSLKSSVGDKTLQNINIQLFEYHVTSGV